MGKKKTQKMDFKFFKQNKILKKDCLISVSATTSPCRCAEEGDDSFALFPSKCI